MTFCLAYFSVFWTRCTRFCSVLIYVLMMILVGHGSNSVIFFVFVSIFEGTFCTRRLMFTYDIFTFPYVFLAYLLFSVLMIFLLFIHVVTSCLVLAKDLVSFLFG